MPHTLYVRATLALVLVLAGACASSRPAATDDDAAVDPDAAPDGPTAA